jgi:hypothetical protein
MARKTLSHKTSYSLLGLVFVATLISIFFLNNYLNPKVQTNWMSKGPVTSKPVSFELQINSPDDETISFDRTILISGKTTPQAVVIISTPSQDQIADANLLGGFSKEISLDPGLNVLYISSFDLQGNSKQIKKTIYYSAEKL